MTRLFSIKPALTLRGRRFRGLRGWAGKPSHPPLTDFPIVAYVLGAVFDLISFALVSGDENSAGAHDFFVAATFVIVSGQIVAFGTVLTGLWDWWKGMDRDRSTGIMGRAKHTQVWRTANWHMVVMFSAVATSSVGILVRIGQWDVGTTGGLSLTLSILAAMLVSFGAVYGGALVYDYQFNVEGMTGSTAWDETEDDQLPGQRA